MTHDNILLTAGTITVVLTLVAYWYLWPQQGKSHALLRGRLEPYIMLSLVTGLVLGCGMIFAGLVPG
jgi:hypothetical protein